MLKTDRIVLVEGKYDAIKLANILDATILRTDGFGIFHDTEKQALLRRLAATRGLLVLTDSDSAGFLIRNFIKSCVPEEQLLQVFIPDIPGKERRKDHPSKEGKLGVEGVPDQVLIDALKQAGITEDGDTEPAPKGRPITALDFYEDGLSGRPNSTQKRRALLKALDLPERMTGKQLLQIINAITTYEDYRVLVDSLE